MPADSSLYGTRLSKSSKPIETSSSSSLAFTANLTSLLAQSKPQTTTSSARPRLSKSKSDIFTSHNRNAKKRALADLSYSSAQAQKPSSGDVVDAATLHRSKRKMEEKARLYTAMKRGDYVSSHTDTSKDERLSLIDFDRKWAEDEAAGRNTTYDSDSSTFSNLRGDETERELTTYEDEFGRQRTGTKADARREQSLRDRQARAAAEGEELLARPSRPTNLIYGNTVQAAAFNPDEPIAAQMETLARKRDRSLTPPEETHYDASKEVRSKGVGFYAFSGDKEGRQREMEDLEREREETERRRGEREREKEERKKMLEERRKVVREKRGERLAERFLRELG